MIMVSDGSEGLILKAELPFCPLVYYRLAYWICGQHTHIYMTVHGGHHQRVLLAGGLS